MSPKTQKRNQQRRKGAAAGNLNASKIVASAMTATVASKIKDLDLKVKALTATKTEVITPFVLDEKYVPPPVLSDNDINVMVQMIATQDKKTAKDYVSKFINGRTADVISDVKSKFEAKSAVSAAEATLQGSLMARMKSGIRSKGLNTSTIWIHERQQPVSAVAGAMTQVLTLTPLNLTETKALAPLYDDVRCVGIKFRVHTSTVNNVGTPANPSVVSDGIFVFDYVTNAALVSVAQGMEFQHHCGPICMSGSGYANSPGADSLQGGFMVSDFIKETKTIDTGLITDLLGGNWVSSSYTGCIVGYIKSYCEIVGAAVASTANVYISYLLEYKHRG